MPELPEVESARRKLITALEGALIVKAFAAMDDIVFDRVEGSLVAKHLEGRRIIGSGRKGKYFWLELDARPWPVLHFGMTGDLHLYRTDSRPLPPSHFKLVVSADNGYTIAITDPRRFGRIRLAQDPALEPPISDLGYDILGEFPNARALQVLLAKRSAPIKAVLLDQKVFAGVGNWIADEVLFQAEIHPARLASRLTAAEVATLRTKLVAIVKKAVDVEADSKRFPKTWLFHSRWGKSKGAETSKGFEIKFSTIGGRTTAWVPKVQKPSR